LNKIEPLIPLEINIHLYSWIERLPYEDADLESLISLLPKLQNLVDLKNNSLTEYKVHLFVGIEGIGYSSEYQKKQKEKWGKIIDEFNLSGNIVFK
jgi:spermidine/putrescine-binding protein